MMIHFIGRKIVNTQTDLPKTSDKKFKCLQKDRCLWNLKPSLGTTRQRQINPNFSSDWSVFYSECLKNPYQTLNRQTPKAIDFLKIKCSELYILAQDERNRNIDLERGKKCKNRGWIVIIRGRQTLEHTHKVSKYHRIYKDSFLWFFIIVSVLVTKHTETALEMNESNKFVYKIKYILVLCRTKVSVFVGFSKNLCF